MVKKNSKYLVALICFVLCGSLAGILYWHVSQAKETSLQYLDQQGEAHTLILSIKDRKRLAGLMQKLFAEDSFAYTILGTKPVSWANYLDHLPFSNWTRFYNSFSKYNRLIRTGWKTWEKYQHLFPTANLWKESSKCFFETISILIIDKEQFNTVVKRNKKDFQDVLQREIEDGFYLLNEAKSSSLMSDVLEGHQALLGIVLGYGRENAWKFLEGCEQHIPLGWVWSEEDFFSGQSVELDSTLTEAEHYLSRYSCPSFAGDPNSEESVALKTEYLLTKQKVLNYYKDKDFLEATLSLLAGYRPGS